VSSLPSFPTVVIRREIVLPKLKRGIKQRRISSCCQIRFKSSKNVRAKALINSIKSFFNNSIFPALLKIIRLKIPQTNKKSYAFLTLVINVEAECA
jgi:hypothetical protein